MKKLTTNEIRKIWLEYFKENDHLIVESQSLIPINDNSLLWINSGVATLKKYFSGEENPPYKNLTNSQKCIRTNDIYNVGKTSRHHTFFEMLGNFSIGGYFKEQAIELAFNLLIKHFKFPLSKLFITVFNEDDITYKKWLELGIDKTHIIKCNKDRNFWDIGSGPCGPCTEIYFDRGTKYDSRKLGIKLFNQDIENDRYIEIWNIVFSEFNNDGKNNYTPLVRKNIDTGAGLERLACVLQNVPTNFDTDSFQIIIKEIEKETQFKYKVDEYFLNDQKQKNINSCFKVIADHIRAVTFALADGAIPSNKERGYIIRRLIRRMIVMFYKLKIEQNIFSKLIDSVNESMIDFYPYLLDKKERSIDILNKEYEVFKKTLHQGLKLFNENVAKKMIDKQAIFKLVETYGFPIEIIEELANEHHIKLDIDGFNELFKQHQIISNANTNIKTMTEQKPALINLKVESKFFYDRFFVEAKVIKLFNEDFNEVDCLKQEDGWVVFDQTCFYATSGGQLNDTGFVNNEFEVDNVIKGPNLQHIHHLKKAQLKLNDKCTLTIDEHRRNLLMKNHSVEHLIHAVLSKKIDPSIKQEGAFKSPQKVTFDFQYHKKLNDEEIDLIEDEINNIIDKKIKVEVLNLTLEQAQAMGAKAYFEDVYKKIKGTLRVIKIGNESCELCGGTHVHNTKEIEAFKIISLSPRGSGSWRIEAITSFETINNYMKQQEQNIKEELDFLKKEYEKLAIKSPEFEKALKQFQFNPRQNRNNILLLNQINNLFKEIKIKNEKNNAQNEMILIKKHLLANVNDTFVVCAFNNLQNKNIFNALSEMINEYQNNVFICLNYVDNKTQYLIATNNCNKKYNLNNLIKLINNNFDGKGGGKINFVQGGANKRIKVEDINYLIDKTFKSED